MVVCTKGQKIYVFYMSDRRFIVYSIYCTFVRNSSNPPVPFKTASLSNSLSSKLSVGITPDSMLAVVKRNLASFNKLPSSPVDIG